MLASYRARLAYLAIPKTASTEIEADLRPECNFVLQGNAHSKHINLREYQTQLVPVFDYLGVERLETVAVIRHPMDWLRSWYLYRQREDELPEFSTADISFDTFAAALLEEEQPTYVHYIGSQYEFLRDAEGKIGVDHLFRYDEMAEFHDFIAARFGRSFAFRDLDVRPSVDLPLSEETRFGLETAFAQDFEFYHSPRRAAA